MKTYSYTTTRGTDVIVTIESFKDIKAKIKGTWYDAQPKFLIDGKTKKQNIHIPSLGMYLQLKDEVYDYIVSLKPKSCVRLTLIDSDLCTGRKYYVLSKRVDIRAWDAIKKYFVYINAKNHSDDFDSMLNSNYIGWATAYPEEVKKILKTYT